MSKDNGRFTFTFPSDLREYPFQIVGFGPDHVVRFRKAIAVEKRIDDERLSFVQTHPHGYDVFIDGNPLTMMCAQNMQVYYEATK